MANFLILFITLFSLNALAVTRNLDKLYEKAKIKIGPKQISAYVADTTELRSDGLMYIESLPTDTGMLFIFEQEQPLVFWMKNTLIPLSIGYFNAKGELLEVQEMKPASPLSLSPPTYPSRGPALFALEMAEGWFDKNKIKPGARLTLAAKVKSTLLKSKLKSRG